MFKKNKTDTKRSIEYGLLVGLTSLALLVLLRATGHDLADLLPPQILSQDLFRI